MDGFKLLVGAACVSVIAASGGVAVWLASDWRAAQRKAVHAELEEIGRKKRVREINREACQAAVDAWDGKKRFPLVKAYGDKAVSVVNLCRDVIESR